MASFFYIISFLFCIFVFVPYQYALPTNSSNLGQDNVFTFSAKAPLIANGSLEVGK
jgi:hypothetical protein